MELFAADEFVDQLKEMRSYGIDGRPIVLHDTLPISPIIDASHVVVVNLLVWGRSGLEQLPASVAGRAGLCVCRANDGELLGVSETVFQS